MPALTVPAVRKYAAQAKRREIRDTLAPGLHLVIQAKPRATKSWAMRFRRPDGRPAKLTLGRVDLSDAETSDEPVVGGALTLRQARQLANKIDRERAMGLDVVEEHKAAKLRRRTASETRAANSFGVAAVEFFRDHRTKWGTRPRRWRGDARVLGLDWPRDCDPASVEPRVIPGGLAATWADKPVADIDGHDVHTIVDEARKFGIPGLPCHAKGTSEARGRAMYAGLAVLFRWCLRRRMIAANPVVGVWHPGAPPARERVLADAEVRWMWRACDQIDPPYGAVFRLLLLTGARLNEVAGMRRAELSDDRTVWTIPSGRTKNHRTHAVPLPPLAREIIGDVPQIESAAGYVFTANGRRPVTSFSATKARLDAAMLAAAREERGDDIPRWTLHDLRRTAATGMAEIGVMPHIVEAALNHVSGARGGVAGIYNRAAYAPEKQVALERWAAHVHGLVSGTAATVTPIRRGVR